MKGRYLITTDAWFYAPDGKKYSGVFGDVEVLNNSVLGIKTNRSASNWYIKVGNEENHIIIAGCQIHYAVKTDVVTRESIVEDFTYGENPKHINRPNEIYIIE